MTCTKLVAEPAEAARVAKAAGPISPWLVTVADNNGTPSAGYAHSTRIRTHQKKKKNKTKKARYAKNNMDAKH